MTPEEPRTRWEELTGGTSGADYAARFERLAATGRDMHGEATLCASLLPPGGRVLDAGCGTGRVAIRLAELGFDCVGVDVDDSMLAVARTTAPSIPWLRADLSAITPVDVGEPFDLVVLAGNVIPLLATGSLPRTVAALAVLLRPAGLLVAGFGLDAAHLPAGCPGTPLEEYDEACTRSGLVRADRFSTWDRQPFTEAGGYAVSVHRN